jgi:hypothetical protein
MPKNVFLKRSMGCDCRINKNKYAAVICMPTGMSCIKKKKEKENRVMR